MKKITDQKDVLSIQLQLLYDVEQELEKSLPRLVKSATDSELVTGLTSHLEETKEHCKRLEKIFEMLGETPTKLRVEAIRGIETDIAEVLKWNSSTMLKDSLIASNARFVEHYEIAGYTTAIAQAKALGLTQVEEILKQTLTEEEAADKKLELAINKNFQNELT